MRKLLAVAASILIIIVSSGCLDQARNDPTLSAAANSTLKVTVPAVVNRSEYATFTCQLNMTRGSGLDNKEIRWAIDNVYKETSRTIWGFAALNLTMEQTQGLTIGKHVVTASFAGDYDYSGSNATTTFSVQIAATPKPSTATPRPGDTKASITLSVPPTVNLGSAHLTGTFLRNSNNQNVYVLVKQAGASKYTVYAPLLEASGKYSVDLSFTTRGNAYLVAIITNSLLEGSINSYPKPDAESSTPTTVN